MERAFTERVYYVSSPQDTAALVGMDIRIEGGYIRWFDTVKERTLAVAHVDDVPGGISVTTVPGEDGKERVYTFYPLTLEIYRDKVKSSLISPRDFEDTESLFIALEETRKNAW